MLEIKVNPIADNALVFGNRWTHNIWSQFRNRVLGEYSGQPFFWQLNPVALNAGNSDSKCIEVRADNLYLNGLPGRLGRGGNWFGRKIKGNSRHIRVSHIKQPRFVRIVRSAARIPADHLLAVKLCTKDSHAQDMRDGAGVPAIGHMETDTTQRTESPRGAVSEVTFHAPGIHKES
jgi:hypothetical protein